MRYVITLLITTICFGCVSNQTNNQFGVIDAGMSTKQVRDIIRDRDGQIFSDNSDRKNPTAHSMTATLSGSGPGGFLWMLFENDRLVVLNHNYYHRSDARPPGISKMECEAKFKRIQAELETIYGPPTFSESKSEGKDKTIALKWQRKSRFILAAEYIDGDYCGSMNVVLFGGSETEYNKRTAQAEAE
ncbi:MAG: hypothetical protein ACOH12_14710 [Parvibaculaceae bacterium]